MRPQARVMAPSSAKSQWYAGGFLRLNSGCCASCADTEWSKKNSSVMTAAGRSAAAM